MNGGPSVGCAIPSRSANRVSENRSERALSKQ
jgi:hypothetical protein